MKRNSWPRTRGVAMNPVDHRGSSFFVLRFFSVSIFSLNSSRVRLIPYYLFSCSPWLLVVVITSILVKSAIITTPTFALSDIFGLLGINHQAICVGRSKSWSHCVRSMVTPKSRCPDRLDSARRTGLIKGTSRQD